MEEVHAHMRVRYNFAFQHLSAARRFAVLCKKVEDENAGSSFAAFVEEIMIYATASVSSSVAALEANINEIFQDSLDGTVPIKGVNQASLSEFWRLLEKESILDKYQSCLILFEHERMDESIEPFQSTQILVRARNALVHYKPKWHDELMDFEKLGKQLKGRFPLSAFDPDPSPIFPRRCMSSGFAQWAISTVKEFCGEFSQKTGCANRFISI